MIFLHDIGAKSKLMLPAEMICALPHGLLTVGRADTQKRLLYVLVDSWH